MAGREIGKGRCIRRLRVALISLFTFGNEILGKDIREELEGMR